MPVDLHSTYIRAISDLVKYEWYHGKLSREDCITKMSTFSDSCFLIRESTSREAQLTLSVKVNSGIHHFIIKRGVDWYEVDGTFKQFFSIPELVKFYEDHSLTDDIDAKLTIPLPM